MKRKLVLDFWLQLIALIFFSTISCFCDYLINQTFHTSQALIQFSPVTFPKLVYLERHNVTKARLERRLGKWQALVSSKLSRPRRFNYPRTAYCGGGWGGSGGWGDRGYRTDRPPSSTHSATGASCTPSVPGTKRGQSWLLGSLHSAGNLKCYIPPFPVISVCWKDWGLSAGL